MPDGEPQKRLMPKKCMSVDSNWMIGEGSTMSRNSMDGWSLKYCQPQENSMFAKPFMRLATLCWLLM